MKLLISGEGPRDLGACNNAQGQCCDGDFNRGPMAVWLARLWENLLDYTLLDIPEAVIYVSENALAQKAKSSSPRMKRQRGKKQGVETGLFFSNAQQLGLMAQQLAADNETPVMAVLFRDADGTRSAPGQMWQTKWKSIVDGFADHFCRRDVAAALQILFRFAIDGASRNQRVPGTVVDDLRVNMTKRTIHAKPRTLGGAGNFGAHAIVYALAV